MVEFIKVFNKHCFVSVLHLRHIVLHLSSSKQGCMLNENPYTCILGYMRLPYNFCLDYVPEFVCLHVLFYNEPINMGVYTECHLLTFQLEFNQCVIIVSGVKCDCVSVCACVCCLFSCLLSMPVHIVKMQ